MRHNVQVGELPSPNTSSPAKPSTTTLKQKILQLWKINQAQIRLWLTFRIILTAIPVIAFALYYPYVTMYKDDAPIGNTWTNIVLGSWARWDGLHYIQIAQQGYDQISLAAFYPLYVLFIHILAFVLTLGHLDSVSLALSGIIVSSLAALATCILLYRLACLDYSSKIASRSVLYFMCFPMAFFLFAVYTEALFMALAIGAFYAARKNRWFLALLLTALAVLTKNQGLVLAVALLAEYASQVEWKLFKIDYRLVYFTLPLIAFLGWLFFNYVSFGDPLEFLTINRIAWDRYAAWPWQTLYDATYLWFHPIKLPYHDVAGLSNLINYPFTLAFLALFVVAGWLTWKKRFRLSYFLFFSGCLFQSLCLPIVNNPLNSLPRYLMLIFPVFFLLAQMGRRSRLFHNVYLVISLTLLLALTGAAGLGLWVA